ncbi:P-loop containing nucleoside triphosphate hydrolase protein [Xylaria acuta]|nr:P-loop containing nucleoside triphosphate hydrolase protein [Xylaria acuta]
MSSQSSYSPPPSTGSTCSVEEPQEHYQHTNSGSPKKDEKKHTEMTGLTVSKVNSANFDPREEPSRTNGSKEDGTMQCKIKYLERRYDHTDEPFFKEPERNTNKPRPMGRWQSFAICIVECFDHNDQPEQTQMYVNSQILRPVLRYALDKSSGESGEMRIPSPYWPLFFQRDEIKAIGGELFRDNGAVTAHLDLLLGWIDSHFSFETRAREICEWTDIINYDYLWTLFPPDTIVVNTAFGKHRAFRYVDFDGEKVGEVGAELLIPKPCYSHVVRLCDLEVKPLELHENADVIKRDLCSRGEKFESYMGQYYGEYNGIALKKTERGYDRVGVEGRIMIDYKTYHRLETNDRFRVEKALIDFAVREKTCGETTSGSHSPSSQLSDGQALITNSTVRGFSFTANKFFEFFVDDIQPITWGQYSFDKLTLEPVITKTLQSLVSEHVWKDESMNYVESGEGKGLKCLLHGPRGVGKTLTVHDTLEESLTRIMERASRWKAVLLIDDADVFVERHASLNFQHNTVVNAFLRMLDNYTGIVFLTTTRVNAIDSAFMSRIHIPIPYKDLSLLSRLHLWCNFYNEMPDRVGTTVLQLRPLAKRNLDRRQIRNIVKATEALAAFDGVSASPATLASLANNYVFFEKNLAYCRGETSPVLAGRRWLLF